MVQHWHLEAFLQDESGPFTTWLCVTWSIMVWGGQMRHNKTWIQIEESIFAVLYLHGPDVFSYLIIFACFDMYCTHTIYIYIVPVMSGVYIWSYFVHESMHPLHTCMYMCGNPSIHPSVRTFMLAIIDVCVLWWQMEMAPLPHWRRRWRSSISLSQQVWGNLSESPKHTNTNWATFFFEMKEPSCVGNSCWLRGSGNIGIYRFA